MNSLRASSVMSWTQFDHPRGSHLAFGCKRHSLITGPNLR